ncbi:MAG: penicillin-binding protein 1B [Gammaproteobacteria bacterium]
MPAKKKSSGKKPGRAGRGKSSARRPAGKSPWRRIILLATVVSVIAGGLYVGYLDLIVQHKFAGKRWALPARVYARPMELYSGAAINREQLLAELNRQGYRRAAHAPEAGTFAASTTRVELYSRGFQFADGSEPAQRVLIEFDQGRIAVITPLLNNEPVDLLRLEPLLIGSFYPRSNEDRLLVRLAEVPQALIDALVAIEDRQFYQHHGVSPRAIGRALWADIKAGKAVQGGSTLTQQLVKNFYLTPKRSLVRKVNEALMALLLEFHFSKDEILEAYLNEVFLGQAGRRAIHGFAQGSQLFFGRPLAELEVDQLALLAGMVKAPTAYHPRRHPERALARRNLVLRVLADQQVISREQGQALQEKPLGVVKASSVGLSRYPAFLDLVRRQLRRDYPDQVLLSEGLNIFSTLDPTLQEVAEQGLQKRLQLLADQTGAAEQLQAAMVIAGVANSEILALVGGRSPRQGGFNRALDAQRSIGSLVKPAVYLTALSQPERYHLNSILIDEPLSLERPGKEPWQPQNYNGRFLGEVPLLDGLLHSMNVPTVSLGLELGLPAVADTLQQLGVNRPIHRQPSLLLGTIGLSPLEVNQIYLTIAAGGFVTPQRAILSVTDRHGETLNRYPLRLQQTLDARAVKLLQLALQEVVRRGTARGLQELGPELNLAAKTGTTDDERDSWLAGFSGNFTAVAWVGRDDNQPTGLQGATGALPLWADVMGQLPLTANSPTTDDQIIWQHTRPGEAAIAAPVGVECSGGYGVPVMAEFAPTDRRPCGSASEFLVPPTEFNGKPLKWLFDKIPWPYD